MILKDAPEGFQPTEIGLIPVDWKLKQAKDISGCIVPGRNKPKKFDGIIPWVTTSDIDELGKIDNSKISLFISKEEANAIGSRVVPANAVIMSCVGELGVVCVAENEIVINQQLHAFLPNSKINSKYLSYILSSLREYFYSKATKTTLPYLNKDNCNSTPIPLTCIEEQTAIANALSDVDALLTELENLIAKKQAIKTATMQQLLTGKTRLPQFATYTEGAVEGKRKGVKSSDLGEIPEDWDVVCINEIATLIGDGIHSTPTYDSNGDYYFVNGNNIHRGKLKLTENTNKVSEAEFKKHKKNINERTLFLSINGTIGNLAYYKNEPIILGKSAAFINIKTSTNLEYAYHMLSHEETQQRFEDGLTGSTIKNLGLGTIKSTLIPIPKLEEQTAIATILSDMDNEIQTLEQRLAKTRQIKQGMMQQLLTGRTRLPFKQAKEA